MTNTSEANVSAVTEANYSPETGASLPRSAAPRPAPPSTARQPSSATRARPYGSGRRGGDGTLLKPAWALGIALGTGALALLAKRATQPAGVLGTAVKAMVPREGKRSEARAQAQQLAAAGDWLSAVLDHHRGIEEAIGAALTARPGADRAAALKKVATVLTGHSVAEEAVLYPALVQAGETARSALAYGQHAMVKTQMAKLQDIDPESDAFTATLEEIRGALQTHMYEEEGTWFPRLKQRVSEMDQAVLTTRFLEEYRRYTHAPS